MAKTPKIRLLRDRQREIDERIAATKAALAELETEAAELKIAAKVLASLSIDDEEDGLAPGVEHTQGAVTDSNADIAVQNPDGSVTVFEVKASVRKPEGLPTMPEMIIAALSNSAVNGKGLEPKQMTEYIAKRWWPEVPFNSVGPIAWRMYKRHELVRRGSRYHLPTPGQGVG